MTKDIHNLIQVMDDTQQYENQRYKHKNNLDLFLEESNALTRQHSFEFLYNLHQHTWFHQAISHGHVTLESKHKDFVKKIANDFGHLTGSALTENNKILVTDLYRQNTILLSDLDITEILNYEDTNGVNGSKIVFDRLYLRYKELIKVTE